MVAIDGAEADRANSAAGSRVAGALCARTSECGASKGNAAGRRIETTVGAAVGGGCLPAGDDGAPGATAARCGGGKAAGFGRACAPKHRDHEKQSEPCGSAAEAGDIGARAHTAVIGKSAGSATARRARAVPGNTPCRCARETRTAGACETDTGRSRERDTGRSGETHTGCST